MESQIFIHIYIFVKMESFLLWLWVEAIFEMPKFYRLALIVKLAMSRLCNWRLQLFRWLYYHWNGTCRDNYPRNFTWLWIWRLLKCRQLEGWYSFIAIYKIRGQTSRTKSFGVQNKLLKLTFHLCLKLKKLIFVFSLTSFFITLG